MVELAVDHAVPGEQDGHGQQSFAVRLRLWAEGRQARRPLPSCEDVAKLCAMTVSIHDVREALEELGKLRFGEMNVQDGMHEIVRTTHAIFDVDGAGLMLTDDEHHLRNVAVSDERVGYLEDLQVKHYEGPCIDALDSRQLICVEDLTVDGRWPSFTADAVAAGVQAIMASPIPYNQHPVGVVAVISNDRHPWTPEGELAVMAFTDLAALLIASMMQATQQTEMAGHLQRALDSRTIIEQAKGIVMARAGLDARAAYAQLRSKARSSRRTLAAVAAEVVADPSGVASPS
jgi:GAF domain-containing protein